MGCWSALLRRTHTSKLQTGDACTSPLFHTLSVQFLINFSLSLLPPSLLLNPTILSFSYMYTHIPVYRYAYACIHTYTWQTHAGAQHRAPIPSRGPPSKASVSGSIRVARKNVTLALFSPVIKKGPCLDRKREAVRAWAVHVESGCSVLRCFCLQVCRLIQLTPTPLPCPGRLAYCCLISPVLRGRRSAGTPLPGRLRAIARRSHRVFSLAASAGRRSCVPSRGRRDVGGLGGVWEG